MRRSLTPAPSTASIAAPRASLRRLKGALQALGAAASRRSDMAEPGARVLQRIGRFSRFLPGIARSCAAAAAFTLSALAAAPASAGAFSLNTSGTSQIVGVVNPVGPVLRFETQTSGSGSFGLTGYTSTDVVDLGTGAGTGTNRFVAANGDELLGTFSVQLSPGPEAGTLLLYGLTLFTGGSGLFSGATGSAALEGFGRFISETEAVVSFSHVGQLSLVPEPGTTALLLAGLGVLAFLARRRPASAPRRVGTRTGPLHSTPSKGE